MRFNKLTRTVLRQSLQVESLESRKLMTVSSVLDPSGVLNIRGDNTADNITVYQSGANTLVRSINSNGVVRTLNMGSNVKSLDIRTFGGNDFVTNNTNHLAVIFGGAGHDTLIGGSDSDVIYGELGSDTINGNEGSDYIFGGGGNDVIRGGGDNDVIEGDDSTHDRLSVSAENALQYPNNDVIYGGGGQDSINGQIGNDRIYGGGGIDMIEAGRGNDVVYGDDGLNSYYIAEDGQYASDDDLNGGDGNDTLYGGYGIDRLLGGNGNDKLYGGENNDKLFGNAGVDFLMGETGDDFLDAGSSAEVDINGGLGNDFNAYTPAINGATFNDIAQGNSANCFILASMSAATARGINLASRITYLGNGLYSVALFKPASSGGYTPTTINVYFDGTLRATDPTAHFRNQEGESWPLIMNRALATLLNVNLETTGGGYAGTVLAAITGRAPTTQTWIDNSGALSPFTPDPFLTMLFNVANAIPTVVGTRNTDAEMGSNLFASNHVYVVQNVFISGFVFSPVTNMMIPQYTIVLYNPWGTDNLADRIANGTGRASGDNGDGVLVISGAEFKRNFDEITCA